MSKPNNNQKAAALWNWLFQVLVR